MARVPKKAFSGLISEKNISIDVDLSCEIWKKQYFQFKILGLETTFSTISHKKTEFGL